MKRIDTTNRAIDLFGAGKDGFKNGNLGLGQLPTEFNADWPNGIQEELLAVVETAGLAASGGDLSQLRKAIDIMLRKMSGAVAAGGGTANAITGAFTPAVTALLNGMRVRVRATATNSTTTPTFQADATAAKTIVRPGGLALVAGDIVGAGHWLTLVFDQALDKWVLENPALPDGLVPPGAVTVFARNTAPNGWLKANGALVSRTTYAALFAAIGTTFGVGDGATTFGLPDGRGEFFRGWDDARGVDTGRVFGSAQTDLFKSHTHQILGSSGIGGTVAILNTGAGGFLRDDTTAAFGGTETRPRNIALLACIKF